MKTGWCKVFPLFLLLVLIPTLCFSQTIKLPVEIKYEDTDTVGLRLAYQIEQLIKKSSSLCLSENQSDLRLILLLMTQGQDPKNSGETSIYSGTIIFAGIYSHHRWGNYWANTTFGKVGADRVQDIAESIVALSDQEWERCLKK